MKSDFEKLGGTYRQEGDYLLPNVKAPESPALGIWGQRRHKYLMEHNHALYTALFLSGKLTTHLEEVDQVATKMYDRLVEQLKERDGITEEYARSRIAAQHNEGWFRERCSHILENNSNLDAFATKCIDFLRVLDII